MTVPTPTDPILLADGAAAMTATGYGQVSATTATYDTGAATFNGLVVANISAITASGGQTYSLNVVGNTASDFSGDSQNLYTSEVNAVGQVLLPFVTTFDETLYRYMRLQVVIAGAGPSVTVQAFVLAQSAYSSLTTDQLTQLLAIYLGNWSTATSNFRAWMAGTATGGPSGNGTYPLADGLGDVVMALCPAAIAASSGAAAGSIIAALILPPISGVTAGQRFPFEDADHAAGTNNITFAASGSDQIKIQDQSAATFVANTNGAYGYFRAVNGAWRLFANAF